MRQSILQVVEFSCLWQTFCASLFIILTDWLRGKLSPQITIWMNDWLAL
jgi:hypothetical protein